MNHIDENKANNRVENLEWCTSKYNTNYGTRNNRIADKLSKSIVQYDLQGKFIKKWESASEVEKVLKINHTHIGSCCNGNRKTAGGYVWKYSNSVAEKKR